MAAIAEQPLAYPRVRGETRRGLVRRFPYAIYFRILAGEVVILAVMHGRQHPRRWLSRR